MFATQLITMTKHTCPHIDRTIFSMGRCKQCASIEYNKKSLQRKKQNPKPINKITPVSYKRSIYNKIYKEVRLKYLNEHPICEANLENCTKKAIEIHHKYMREGIWLIISAYFLPVCRNCHNYIEKNPEFSLTNGLIISSISKINKKFTLFERDIMAKYNIIA